jgi:hypothetical protein
MRFKILLLALFQIVICSCERQPEKQTKVVETIVYKKVKAIKESTETTYKYKYNIWRGKFYHQPDVHSVYYLVFTDGTFEEVDVAKASITEVGDSIKKVETSTIEI